MLSDNTKNFLSEMARSGVDPAVIAGLERELDSNSNADKTVNNGVLAQASFNSYRTNKDNEIKELKDKMEQTASLSTAANNLSGDLKEAALKQIQENKEWFESQGYDIGEVEKLASDMASKGILFTAEKANQVIKGKENIMPENQAGKNYIDDKTLIDVLKTTGSNLASGGINMSVIIARAMHKADKLGIDLTDEKLDKMHEVIIKGLEQNKDPNQVIDEHLGFSVAIAAKNEATRKAELEAAEQKGRQEALKEAGVTIRNSNGNRPKHLIFDRDTPMSKAIKENRREKAEEESKHTLENLPENKLGDKEYYRLRGTDEERRSRHLENASKRFSEVSVEFSPDGEYIGHKRSA